MKTVMKKDEFIHVVTKNKAKHVAELDDAIMGYKAMAVKELEEQLTLIGKHKNHQIMVSLHAPEDHSDDYDRVITMAVYNTDPTITLDEHEFRQYVMNQWDWLGRWAASNVHYIGAGKALKQGTPR